LRVEPAPAAFDKEANLINPEDEPTTECPGSVSEPEAAPGEFCLYTIEPGPGVPPIAGATIAPSLNDPDQWAPDRTIGLLIPFEIEAESARARGTWAVTACPLPPTEEEEDEGVEFHCPK
jgi:hypothetical protein